MPTTKSARIPSYRLHKPTGLAVVRLNGRDVYLGKHATPESHDRYRQIVSEWLANAQRLSAKNRESIQPGAADLTVNELFVAYWSFAETYYVKNGRPTGELQNLKDAMRPLVSLHGESQVRDFGPAALKTVRVEMVGMNLCRKVINGRINRIRRMFKWGVENELVNSSVLQALQAISALKQGRCEVRESEPVKPVPEADVQAVLAIVARQIAAMIRLQLLTGMRPCEITIMRGCDLETTGKIWTYRPASHKTEHHGRERVIYLGPAAQRIVAPFLKSDTAAFLFDPRDVMKERYAACRTQRSDLSLLRKTARKLRDHYTTTTYGRAIAYGCEQAFSAPPGLINADRRRWHKDHLWSPNQLRHNAATFLRRQYGIDAARVILGHSTPAITEVYAELDHLKAMQIMAEVG